MHAWRLSYLFLKIHFMCALGGICEQGIYIGDHDHGCNTNTYCMLVWKPHFQTPKSRQMIVMGVAT